MNIVDLDEDIVGDRASVIIKESIDLYGYNFIIKYKETSFYSEDEKEKIITYYVPKKNIKVSEGKFPNSFLITEYCKDDTFYINLPYLDVSAYLFTGSIVYIDGNYVESSISKRSVFLHEELLFFKKANIKRCKYEKTTKENFFQFLKESHEDFLTWVLFNV